MAATAHRLLVCSAGRLGMIAGLTGASLGLMVLASCTQPQSRMQSGVLPPTTRPVLHAVYAQELRQAMHELNVQTSQQVWMQLYTSEVPVADMSQISQAAEKMATVAATRLPKAASSIEMDNDRQLYLGLAQRLHDQAVVLKQQADRNELTAAQTSMNQIIGTCNTCHTLFRSVAGPISH